MAKFIACFGKHRQFGRIDQFERLCHVFCRA
jgi:hypothetical protein